MRERFLQRVALGCWSCRLVGWQKEPKKNPLKKLRFDNQKSEKNFLSFRPHKSPIHFPLIIQFCAALRGYFGVPFAVPLDSMIMLGYWQLHCTNLLLLLYFQHHHHHHHQTKPQSKQKKWKTLTTDSPLADPDSWVIGLLVVV